MTLVNLLILFLAALLAGTLNSVAGGGSFITFPSLISVGVQPISANATNTVALWPGSVAAGWALRKELVKQNRALLLALMITSLLGGIAGAILLLKTPQTIFVHLIPYLMLVATLLFAFSPLMNAKLKERAAAWHKRELKIDFAKQTKKEGKRVASSALMLSGLALLQLVIAVYGGYFGGGIGILMLASLGLMGMENIHLMNALKNPLVACINGVAVITFIIAGAVDWLHALTMIGGAMIGGFGGAYYARKLDPYLIRWFVIVIGCAMTLYFFIK